MVDNISGSGEQTFEFRRRHGSTEIIALCETASHVAKQGRLGPLFHSLGNDFQLHAFAKREYRPRDGGVLLVARQFAYEGLVDLEFVQWHAPQSRQR